MIAARVGKQWQGMEDSAQEDGQCANGEDERENSAAAAVDQPVRLGAPVGGEAVRKHHLDRLALKVCPMLSICTISVAHTATETLVGPASTPGRTAAGGSGTGSPAARAVALRGRVEPS